MVIRRRSVQTPRVLRLHPRPAFRRRSRRVLSAFLKLRREAGNSVEVFDAGHVERMLRSGRPGDAQYYLERFLLPVPIRDSSRQSKDLLAHVGVFKTLAKVVAGGEEGARVASLFANPSEYVLQSPASVRLHKIIALLHADRTRASMIWEKLEQEGLETIMGLVAKCPELQGVVRLPRKRPLLWDAAPQGLRQCPSRCRPTTNHAPTNVLIRTFLQKRLLSVQGKTHSVRSSKASFQSAAASPCMKMEQIAPEPTILEGGVSHDPVLHHIPHTMAGPAESSGILSSAVNAVANGECGDSSSVLEKQGITSLNLI
ncbi:hypothetical protein ACP70R_028482 [Stipagrostis hirtigluma subsp. patula]